MIPDEKGDQFEIWNQLNQWASKTLVSILTVHFFPSRYTAKTRITSTMNSDLNPDCVHNDAFRREFEVVVPRYPHRPVLTVSFV